MRYKIIFLSLVIVFLAFCGGCAMRINVPPLHEWYEGGNKVNPYYYGEHRHYYHIDDELLFYAHAHPRKWWHDNFGRGYRNNGRPSYSPSHSGRRYHYNDELRYTPTQFEREEGDNDELHYSPTRFPKRPVKMDEERFEKPFTKK